MEEYSSKILAIQSELEEISDVEFSDQSDQEIESRKKRTVAFSSLQPRPTFYAHLGSFLSTDLPHYAAHVAGLRGCMGVMGVPKKSWRISFGPREENRFCRHQIHYF
eukprot:GHVP01049683.1.p1 GENE.GHVP01049683.1~~GHVP01049683.1.p1  ORF type:complete len:107 (+),score=24.05 GHVP01049683.1:174-494(+)